MAASYAVHMLRYAATAPWIAATPGACEAVGDGADNVNEGDGLGCAPPDLQAVTVHAVTTTTMANETIRTRRTCTSPIARHRSSPTGAKSDAATTICYAHAARNPGTRTLRVQSVCTANRPNVRRQQRSVTGLAGRWQGRHTDANRSTLPDGLAGTPYREGAARDDTAGL